MLLSFKENQIIKIVPQDVEATCSVRVLDSCEEFLCVELVVPQGEKVLTGKAECFTNVDDGIIYFKSKISKIDENQYKLTLPITHKLLQRREYTRISVNNCIVLKVENREVDVLMTDLSAGGMRLISPKELSLSGEYECTLELDKTHSITTLFAPIRQDKNEKGSYVTSGKFSKLSNKDRIALAQYCFRKQMENINK